MKIIHTIPGGFYCSAAGASDTWTAAVTVIPDIDGAYTKTLQRFSFELHPGKTVAEWQKAFSNSKRTLALVSEKNGKVKQEEIAQAKRISRPAVVCGCEPAVAWCELTDDTWRLMLWTPSDVKCVHQSRGMLYGPAIAYAGDEILIACEHDRDGTATTMLFWPKEENVYTTKGRNPFLIGAESGKAYLIVECVEENSIQLSAQVFSGATPTEKISFPQANDYNLHANIALDEDAETLYATWESCPAWGCNELLGVHRDISLWTLAPGQRKLTPARGTSNGYLHVPREAFFDIYSDFNFTAIQPRVISRNGVPFIFFRRFRYFGQKCFGWDIYMMRWNGQGWEEPSLISPHAGPPDIDWAVFPEKDGFMALLPCCDHMPRVTFQEEKDGKQPRETQPATHFRAEIIRFRETDTLASINIPPGHEAHYVIPPSIKNVAPDPPPFTENTGDNILVWGDLHAHSAYSKCMSANDGLPREVLRNQRDVLGCRVLGLTEHVEYIGCQEFTHILDCIEEEAAGSCVPLYGVEWGMNPAHHTNFYAVDRDVFERLRKILLSNHHLSYVFRGIKQELPAGSVLVVRHFHGIDRDEYGIGGERATETYDAELEVAMEAMQTRGNMMMPGEIRGRRVPFPNNFLNAGAKVGLLGGSDHSRGWGPNHFCLTGFWIKECTPEAIFECIRNRKTIATSNGKIALYPTLLGTPMGACMHTSAPVRMKVNVSSARTVRQVCLMRDGELLPWVRVDDTEATVELVDNDLSKGTHWYTVTAEADSVFRKQPVLAHASPFFLSIDE